MGRARVLPFRLPLREPLATTHGPIAERAGLLLALCNEAGGHTGFGESAPLPGFGLETLDASGRALAQIARWIEGRDIEATDALLDEVEARWSEAPAARGAIDVALHDLLSRTRGWSVARLLRDGAPPRERVPACALVSGADAGKRAARARAARDAGFRTLKLKLGGRALDEDLARVTHLREALGDDVRLRLDANQAWKEAEAPAALGALAGLGVEYVEEPVSGGAEALARLRADSPVPIAADESACGETAAGDVIACRAADVLVLKPTAAGGLRAALRIADRARRAGLDVVVGSFLDSAVGVAAALALAAALPGPLRAAGLATGVLMARDLAPPLRADGGGFALPLGPGLGVQPVLGGSA